MGLRFATSLIFAIGCASEPATSICEEAAATLERCAGQVPSGFLAACEADPETVAPTVLSQANVNSCPDAAKSDSILKDAFEDACVAVVNATYWVVWARSPASKPMPTALRDQLRPWFGDLVDTTKVSWNAELIGRWRVLGRDVVLDDDTIAQTFDDEIYIRESMKLDDRQIALIGHELEHANQYREHGGVLEFARGYCGAFYDSEFSYRNNALEVEAYDQQGDIYACLARDQGCPN
jgi:hypothetical protein